MKYDNEKKDLFSNLVGDIDNIIGLEEQKEKSALYADLATDIGQVATNISDSDEPKEKTSLELMTELRIANLQEQKEIMDAILRLPTIDKSYYSEVTRLTNELKKLFIEQANKLRLMKSEEDIYNYYTLVEEMPTNSKYVNVEKNTYEILLIQRPDIKNIIENHNTDYSI